MRLEVLREPTMDMIYYLTLTRHPEDGIDATKVVDALL